MSRRHGNGRVRPRARGRLMAAGALAIAVVVAVGIAIEGPVAEAADPGDAAAAAPAVLAPVGTTTTAVTTGDRSLQVAVSPYSGLPPSGAQITVTGSGFDPDHDLWVAICQDDGVAPAALLHCIGGAIPEHNSSTGWGIVTSADEPPYAGPVTTRWRGNGSFRLTLHLPSAMSDDADCISAPCSVYTRSSDDTDRGEDVRVPVSFAAPPGDSTSPTTSDSTSGSSSDVAETSATTSTPATTTTSSAPTTTAEPSTSTYGGAPTTVSPEVVLETSATAGEKQTVLFAGFTPGEKVDVTLYSKPVTLPTETANESGNVRITFTIPKKLPAGEHLLQAIGRKSGRVGIARFSVGAAPTTASATASATESAGASTSAPASAAASTTGAATPSLAGSATESVASSALAPVVPSAVASSAAASSASTSVAAGGAADEGGNRLLWLWIVLAVLVVVGGAAGAVAMVRHRRDSEDEVPATRVDPVPPTPGWSTGVQPSPGPGSAEPGGGFGLLAGREHPDGPALYSGSGWEQRPGPGDARSDAPTQALGPDADPGERGAGQDPATEQWRPDFTGAQPPAGPGAGQDPATEQWRPDFTDDPGSGGGDEAPGGRHRSE